LDGVRALAVLVVLVAHVQTGFAHRLSVAGSVGVAVFFALSGFLITRILLARPPLTTFFCDRALRLLPAMLAFVLLAGLVQQVRTGYPLARMWPAATYLGNWLSPPGEFTHLWSLAVEEQFYLVWPVLIVSVRRWRLGPVLLCSAGLAASLVVKLALWDGGHGAVRLYFGSDTQAWALLCGCLLASLMHLGLRTRSVPGLGLAAVAALLVAAWLPGNPVSTALVAPVVAPVGTAVVIWGACGSSDRLLGHPALRWVGRRSYSLYLWHPFALGIGADVLGTGVAGAVTGLILAGLAAELSWQFVETPFLRLKGRRTATAAAVVRAPQAAPVVVRDPGTVHEVGVVRSYVGAA
jgi:peptidoglycan/LPS O-acetylase OafA/YrhL